MKTYLECIPCFVRQALDAIRMTTDDEGVQLRVLRQALKLASDADLTQSPPAMGQQIHRFIRELTGNPDPYVKLKDKYNKVAMQMYPDLRVLIGHSAEPMGTAVRLAIAGNIIDFGVNSDLEESQVSKTVAESLESELDEVALKEFEKAVSRAKNILYIGDNAGEIIFDRLLIEQMPTQKIAFVVRGSPVLNDVTMEDAVITGMTDVVEVIDNGSDAPGTILDSCSKEFRDRFDRAELIIAKGQGNYETLSDIEKDIFFMLKAKCTVAAKNLGCNIGDMILTRNTTVASVKKT